MIAFLLFVAVSAPQIQLAPSPFRELRRMVPPGIVRETAIEFGDIDGDGDPDALAFLEGSFGPQLSFLRNDGHGRLELTERAELVPLPCYTTACLPSAPVSLGDVDGDGVLDALLGRHVYLGDGDGRFARIERRAIQSSSALFHARLVELEPGRPADIVAFERQSGAVYRNDGSGRFQITTALTGWTEERPVVADLDGDGLLDIAYADLLSGGVRVLQNQGDGIFGNEQVRAVPERPGELSVADFDGDGALDLLHSIGSILWNDGSGVFTDGFSSGITTYSRGQDVGDVNGDGAPDVVTSASYGIWLNDGAGGFVDGTSGIPSSVGSGAGSELRVLDLDRDGDLEIVTFGYNELELLLGDGRGQFAASGPAPIPTGFAGDAPQAFADVDGDGDQDALSGFDPFLWRNDGRGTMVPEPSAFGSTFGPGSAIAVADFDGDGDVDVIGSARRLYLNDGTGLFTEGPGRVPPLSTSFYVGLHDLGLLDVEGDGDLDVVVARSALSGSGYPNELWVNDGSGFFSASEPFPGAATPTYSVAAADFDGDGNVDVAFGNLGANELYLGDGAGAFQEASALLPQNTGWTRRLCAGDLDGDGQPDLYAGNQGGSPPTGPVYERYATPGVNDVYLNRGGSRFELAPTPPLADATFTAQMGDLDGDGDLDVVTAETIGRRRPMNLVVLINDGGGTLIPANLPRTQRVYFSLGDIDGDLDLDLFFGDGWYTNVTRQVARRQVARPGRPLELEIFGPAHGRYVLVGALELGTLPLGDLGLRLDPTSMVFAAQGGLSARGEAIESYLVPEDPALVRRSFYWQAVVGPVRAVTNVEITTPIAF